jgi:hypothetical protein
MLEKVVGRKFGLEKQKVKRDELNCVMRSFNRT